MKKLFMQCILLLLAFRLSADEIFISLLMGEAKFIKYDRGNDFGNLTGAIQAVYGLDLPVTRGQLEILYEMNNNNSHSFGLGWVGQDIKRSNSSPSFWSKTKLGLELLSRFENYDWQENTGGGDLLGYIRPDSAKGNIRAVFISPGATLKIGRFYKNFGLQLNIDFRYHLLLDCKSSVEYNTDQLLFPDKKFQSTPEFRVGLGLVFDFMNDLWYGKGLNEFK